MTDRAEVVVVGGGIAGLSAAWELRDRDVVVLEAETRIGGRLMSEPRGPYWLNFGGHVLAGEDSATGRLLNGNWSRRLPRPGRPDRACDERARALERPGRDLPAAVAATRAGAPGSRAGGCEGAPGRGPVRPCRPPPARARPTRPGSRACSPIGMTARSPTSSARVPAEVDAIFRPTIQRSSGEPEQVAAGYGIGYFQLVWDREGGLTRNVLGGSARLPEAITDALGDRVRTGSPVERVVPTGDGVTVHGDGGRIDAQYAVVAAPAFAAREMIAGLPSDTAAALGRIAYGPYVVGAFLTDEPGPMPYDHIYALATPKRSFNMLFNTACVTRTGGARDARRHAHGLLRREPGRGARGARRRRGSPDLLRRRGGDIFARSGRTSARCRSGAGRTACRIRARADTSSSRRSTDRSETCSWPATISGTTYVETAVSTGTAAAHEIRRRLRGNVG